jgi:hypothetical protein
MAGTSFFSTPEQDTHFCTKFAEVVLSSEAAIFSTSAKLERSTCELM